MRIFGIRGSVGLFLTILILKFLMSEPFGAFEHFLVTFFSTAGTTLENANANAASPMLIPSVPL